MSSAGASPGQPVNQSRKGPRTVSALGSWCCRGAGMVLCAARPAKPTVPTSPLPCHPSSLFRGRASWHEWKTTRTLGFLEREKGWPHPRPFWRNSSPGSICALIGQNVQKPGGASRDSACRMGGVNLPGGEMAPFAICQSPTTGDVAVGGVLSQCRLCQRAARLRLQCL